MSELNIPEHWVEVDFEQAIQIQGGSQPPKSDFIDKPKKGYVRLIQIRDFRTDNHPVYIPVEKAKRSFTKDDIMIGRYGPPVFQILRGKEGSYNVALMKAVPTALMNKEFMYWFLRNPSIYRDVNSVAQRSAGQTGVNLDFLNRYPVPVPPIGEQERIVHKIESCFQKIDEIEKALSDIENTISKLCLSFLMKSGEWLAPKNLREITSERVEKVGIKAPSLRKIGVDNKLGVVDLRVTGSNTFEKYKIVCKGDILYNPMRANVGSLALYLDDAQAITSPDYIVFSVNKGASKWLVFKFLKSSFGLLEIAKKLKGSVRERLYYDKLADIDFPCPSPEISLQADKFLDILDVSIQQKKYTFEKLISSTRESVLMKAFDGELVSRISEEGTGQELLDRVLLNSNQIPAKSEEKKVISKRIKNNIKKKAKK